MLSKDNQSESNDNQSSTPSLQASSQESWRRKQSLIILIVQNTALVLTLRYTRVAVDKNDLYFTSTAIAMAEVLKLCICLIVISSHYSSFQDYIAHLYKAIVVNWVDTLMMSVPAIIFMVQGNLLFFALSHLEAAVFQVTIQLKILTTALFSVLLLGKKLSPVQWGSLVLLFAGVALVQVNYSSTPHDSAKDQRQLLGFVAVFSAALCSGFSCVYFEKMLKSSDASVWLRNVQLGMFAPFAALFAVLMKDGNEVLEKGFFHGYSPLVLLVIVEQAAGGLIVAMVVRYADNILKGFATSLSIILSSILSVFIFDYTITLLFTVGVSMVLGAIFLYGRKWQPASQLDPGQTFEEEPAGQTTTGTSNSEPPA